MGKAEVKAHENRHILWRKHQITGVLKEKGWGEPDMDRWDSHCAKVGKKWSNREGWSKQEKAGECQNDKRVHVGIKGLCV